MENITELVKDATAPLNTRKAEERAKASGSNSKTLIVAYAVLIIVILLQFQGISISIVGPVAVLGLVAIVVLNWLQRRKIYSIIYQQEIHRLETITQLAQEKQSNGNNILGAIKALAASVDAKDHYTYGHSEKVAKYTVAIAKKLGYPPGKLESIRIAALLHDIGKIGVSDQLLSRPGVLSRKEWKELRNHPELGVDILKNIDAIKDSLSAVLHHHEKYDGSGYPEGLKGENIPLDARILAVADSYDAMTSQRPYRPCKMTQKEGLAELIRCVNKQFDPRVISAFTEVCLKPYQAKGELENNTTTYHLDTQEEVLV